MLHVTTHTLAVNAAFLKEIKDDHEELRRLLNDAIVAFTEHTDVHRVADLMCKIHEQLVTHFYLEEAFGYFEDALVEQPWLGDKAEVLRSEHAAIARWMERLAAHAICIEYTSELPLLMRDFQDFLEIFQRHEEEEIDLIMTAFTEEIGVGD